MKFLIVLAAVIACGCAATLPQFTPIATHQESQNAAGLQSRIANGYAAIANQFPHQCSMLAPVAGNFYLCGGSIISTTWVLTAAHCTVPHDQFNLRFGTLTLFTGGISQTSFHSIVHPNYNPIILTADVSLISIPVPLTLTPSIAPVRLAALSQVGAVFVNVQSQVSGWGGIGGDSGVQSLLRWVYMRPITNEQCATYFGTLVVGDYVLCAVGYANPANQGHCGGDSGGALTISEGGITTQIGVVSFGAAAGCDLGFPSGYMRTSNYVEWVEEHTGIEARP